MWNTGECQIEIVNVETEETILDNYMVVSASSEFNKVLSPFFEKMNLDSLIAEKRENLYEFKL
jgi:hypothetical protein